MKESFSVLREVLQNVLILAGIFSALKYVFVSNIEKELESHFNKTIRGIIKEIVSFLIVTSILLTYPYPIKNEMLLQYLITILLLIWMFIHVVLFLMTSKFLFVRKKLDKIVSENKKKYILFFASTFGLVTSAVVIYLLNASIWINLQKNINISTEFKNGLSSIAEIFKSDKMVSYNEKYAFLLVVVILYIIQYVIFRILIKYMLNQLKSLTDVKITFQVELDNGTQYDHLKYVSRNKTQLFFCDKNNDYLILSEDKINCIKIMHVKNQKTLESRENNLSNIRKSNKKTNNKRAIYINNKAFRRGKRKIS